MRKNDKAREFFTESQINMVKFEQEIGLLPENIDSALMLFIESGRAKLFRCLAVGGIRELRQACDEILEIEKAILKQLDGKSNS